LRRNLSLPEGLLWQQLRRKPQVVKFRRQHPVGRYVIDFYCAAVKAGFEVDGFARDTGDRPEHDAWRTDFIQGQGIRLERIPAAEVLADAQGIADSIVSYCLGKRG
jgi:very-short-patch-repair endonuclease